jgi:hypothetical protein
MIVVNEIHDFEEIPPQVQHFAVLGSKKASATAGAFFLFVFLCSPNTHSARLREHADGLSFPGAFCSTAEGTLESQNVTADVLDGAERNKRRALRLAFLAFIA